MSSMVHDVGHPEVDPIRLKAWWLRMGGPTEATSDQLHNPPSYSAAARKVLAFIAAAVTFLPLPITYFRILPAYQEHAHFLLFYAPFVCLLTLSYLFYVRDSLARVMFADLLDPPPPPDPYYQEPFGERLSRWLRRLKGIALGVLPALLVITSMYCVSRYVVSFDRSVARAAQIYVDRATKEEEVRAAREKQRGRVPTASRQSGRRPALSDSTALDSLPQASDSAGVRQYVLNASRMGSIPGVVGLTALYIGAFVALLVAVTIMALKEYAKEAMGLSEHELMFGRYHSGGEQ
jgi:hypothetical protein